MFQAFWGGSEETQVVFCQHQCDHLNPADCFHLLCYHYHCPCRLCREEKESNILGWDATRRSSSVFNSQQGSWRRICAATGVELGCEREEGRKVPPLLDHHHLSLHLNLLHNNLFLIKHYLYSGRHKFVCIELKCHEYFLTDMFLLPSISKHILTLNSTNVCKQNKETRSFNSNHHFMWSRPEIMLLSQCFELIFHRSLQACFLVVVRKFTKDSWHYFYNCHNWSKAES